MQDVLYLSGTVLCVFAFLLLPLMRGFWVMSPPPAFCQRLARVGQTCVLLGVALLAIAWLMGPPTITLRGV